MSRNKYEVFVFTLEDYWDKFLGNSHQIDVSIFQYQVQNRIKNLFQQFRKKTNLLTAGETMTLVVLIGKILLWRQLSLSKTLYFSIHGCHCESGLHCSPHSPVPHQSTCPSLRGCHGPDPHLSGGDLGAGEEGGEGCGSWVIPSNPFCFSFHQNLAYNI